MSRSSDRINKWSNSIGNQGDPPDPGTTGKIGNSVNKGNELPSYNLRSSRDVVQSDCSKLDVVINGTDSGTNQGDSPNPGARLKTESASLNDVEHRSGEASSETYANGIEVTTMDGVVNNVSESELVDVSITYSKDLTSIASRIKYPICPDFVIEPSIMEILSNPSDIEEQRMFNKFLAVELQKSMVDKGSMDINEVPIVNSNEVLIPADDLSSCEHGGKNGPNSVPSATVSAQAIAVCSMNIGDSAFHKAYAKRLGDSPAKQVKNFFVKDDPIVMNMSDKLRFLFKRKDNDRAELIKSSSKIVLDLDGEVKLCAPVVTKKMKRVDTRAIQKNKFRGVGVDGRKLIKVSVPKTESCLAERSLPPLLHVGYKLGKSSPPKSIICSKDINMKTVWEQMKKARMAIVHNTSNFVKKLQCDGFKDSVLGTVPAIKNFVFGSDMEEDLGSKMDKGSYAKVTAGNREQLQYCPPVVLETGEKVVMLKTEILVQAKQLYRNHLYGHFVGSDLSLAFVRFNLFKMWKKQGIVDIQTNGSGIFLFKFESTAGMKAILESGPWVVSNVPLCIKQWEPGVNMDRSDPKTVPTWIIIKGLPMELWNTKGVCQVASCVGHPILFDKTTQNKCDNTDGATGFARVLVEIKADEDQPDRVRVLYPQLGGLSTSSVNVCIEYQAKPPKCMYCMVFGHSLEECVTRPVTTQEQEIKNVQNAGQTDAVINEGVIKDAKVVKDGDDGFQPVGKKNTRKQGEAGNKSVQNSPTKEVPSSSRLNSPKSAPKGKNIGSNNELKQNVVNNAGSNSQACKHKVVSPAIDDKTRTELKPKVEYRVKSVKGGESKKTTDRSDLNVPVKEIRMKLQNRFESLQTEDMIVDTNEDTKRVESIKEKELRCIKNEKICNKYIRNLLVGIKKAESGSELLFGTMAHVKPPDILPNAPVDKLNEIFDDFYDLLEQKRKDEVISCIQTRQIPHSSVLEKWSHHQLKFYCKLCLVHDFREGIGFAFIEYMDDAEGSDGYFSAPESEINEVASEENEMGRGLVKKSHQNQLLSIMNEHRVHICCVVETHVKSQSLQKVCSHVFGSWNWVANNVYCQSWVRIIVAWDPAVFDVMVVSLTDQLINCLVKSRDGKYKFYCTFVYAHTKAFQRKPLWFELEKFGNTINDEPWLVSGDFNATLDPAESSSGTSHIVSSIDDFRNCCLNTGISDIPFSGLKFTWNKTPGKANGLLKKLDRVMGNSCFLSSFPETKVHFLPFYVSDHSPSIITLPVKQQWRPKPFKFQNYLTRKPSFLPIVENAWKQFVPGCMMYSVVTKLKSMKKPLRKLALEQGNLTEKVIILRSELGRVQEELVNDNSNQALRDEELVYLQALKIAEEDEELFLKQKAKVEWLAAGDQNTSYFHKAVKGWQSRSRIHGILDMQGNYYEGEQVGDAFVNHFKSFMGCDVSVKPINCPATLFTKKIPRNVADFMVRPVTNDEIKAAMFDIDDDKAPGPDGFSARFFKCSWSIIGGEVCHAIKEFFDNGKLLTEINATIISLVPKCRSPSMVADFRPIACCNVLYKGITKVICNRLKDSLDLVVSNNQSAFVPGRQISDNVLLTQELMRNYHRKSGARRLAVKIDLQKAYDTVSHCFLEDCLINFGYHPCMVAWIMKCLRSACYSINVNGHSHGFFKGLRGLRQGDPMSPYLFTLVMEILSLMIKRKINEAENFTYHWKCSKLGITNLCFADDLLVFMNADTDSVKVIKTALKEFNESSGLLPNMNKSTMYFGNVPPGVKAQIMELLPFKVGSLPVRYLGLPLLAKRLYSKDCASLIDKVKKRVNDWKNKSLSFAGRLQLIKSVLSSMQVYWASVFLLPVAIIEDIERIMNKFLWTQSDSVKGKVRVSWDDVCLPKAQGGLGIKSLRVRNMALVSKLVWNIVTRKDNIWVEWIYAHRLKDRSFWGFPDKRDKCWSWRNIMKCRNVVWPHCHSQIGNGEKTSVWYDLWHPLSPLCAFISSREINRVGLSTNAKVKDVIGNEGWDWPEEWQDKFPGLFEFEPPKLMDGKGDRVVWKSNNDSLGEFSTKRAFNDLCIAKPDVSWASIVWFSQSIPRHSFVLWLACRGRLLTQDRLQRWDKERNLKCVFCSNQCDSHTHLFFECEYPQRVWVKLKRIALLDNAPSTLLGCAEVIKSSTKTKSVRAIIQRLMLAATVYFIWQERNLRTFQNKERSVETLCIQIQEIVRMKLLGLKIRKTPLTMRMSEIWGFKVYQEVGNKDGQHAMSAAVARLGLGCMVGQGCVMLCSVTFSIGTVTVKRFFDILGQFGHLHGLLAAADYIWPWSYRNIKRHNDMVLLVANSESIHGITTNRILVATKSAWGHANKFLATADKECRIGKSEDLGAIFNGSYVLADWFCEVYRLDMSFFTTKDDYGSCRY
ncbi:hypothetical protein SSX86_002127 [Deinandra increscens subsp. villosa]|uniref:Reverse transcriptase domain-containing protein n=1 Tax=Deinandra increscens subsp. villosa TaxID=3103831 RepID=A0AAP0DMZ7_9ASTR